MLTHLCDNTARELCSAQPAVVPTTNLLTAELSRNWRQTNGYTRLTLQLMRSALMLQSPRRRPGRTAMSSQQQLCSARPSITCMISR